jgi:hypothetical protein
MQIEGLFLGPFSKQTAMKRREGLQIGHEQISAYSE